VADVRSPRRANSARLLTKAQAAAYCGTSVATFRIVCPVRPIALGKSKRLERFDIVALDRWIDGMSADGAISGRDWLAAMDTAHDHRSR
jgi:hypothetical protein